jgi:hypothetical protein
VSISWKVISFNCLCLDRPINLKKQEISSEWEKKKKENQTNWWNKGNQKSTDQENKNLFILELLHEWK